MACYPSQALGGRPSICNRCYASQSCSTCSTQGAGTTPACVAYCNSGCNTICVSTQAFCQIGVTQYVRNHGDVGNQTFPCLVQNEIISKNWTATWWNSFLTRLRSVYTTPGNGSGEGKKQPASGVTLTNAVADTPNASSHPANSLVTADKYNQIAATLRDLHANVPNVAVNDVIKSAVAQAQQTGWNSATWDTDVCDICNATGNQNANNCNCNCTCSCNCACSCSCNCTCSCDCSCTCTCSSSGRS